PASTTVVVTLDTSLHVIVDNPYQYGAVATRQRFEDGRFLVRHADFDGTPRTMHLAALAPGVLRVPDSILVTGDLLGYFPGVGGDTPGAPRIVASAHGFRPDTSALVTVGQGHLVLPHTLDTAFVGGTGYTVTVNALSPRGVALPLDTN